MKLWTTQIRALDPHTKEMKTWMGDYVEAPTEKLAQEWCDKNKGYLKVIGELIAEIPCKENTSKIDYENIQNN